MVNAQEGAFAFYLILGTCLTLLVGLFALMAFRRAVATNMKGGVTSPEVISFDQSTSARRAADAQLAFRVVNARQATSTKGVKRTIWRIAAAHAAAGLVFGVVAATFLLVLSGTELLPLRTVAVAWAFAWPTVLALILLVGPDRPVLAWILICYFGGIVALCFVAWLADVPSFSAWGDEHVPSGGGSLVLPGALAPALIWAIYAAPSLLLLLVLNRAVRAIGPLVLVFVVVMLAGSHVTLSILAIEPVMWLAAALAAETGLGGSGVFFGFASLGMLLAAWPAWHIVRYISGRYAEKRFSDLMLVVTVIWLLQTLVLASSLVREGGALGLIAAPVPFIAWLVVLRLLLGPIARAARNRAQYRLLLLRVFGFGRRSRRLVDLIGARWRTRGGIDLIAAPDLASTMVEPDTFLQFVRGRLRDLFVRSSADLEQHLGATDRTPDPDGRFRITQTFCSGEIWKQAVRRLMDEASLVVMDLRGFGPKRQGCVFELQTLLDAVPLNRLAILIDDTTDSASLEGLAQERWNCLDVGSPNLTIHPPELLLLDISQGETAAIDYLLALASLAPTVNGRAQSATQSRPHDQD